MTGRPPQPPGPRENPLDFPPMAVCAGCQREETVDVPTKKCSGCDLTRSVDDFVRVCCVSSTEYLLSGTAPLSARRTTGASIRRSASRRRRSSGCGRREWVLMLQGCRALCGAVYGLFKTSRKLEVVQYSFAHHKMFRVALSDSCLVTPCLSICLYLYPVRIC